MRLIRMVAIFTLLPMVAAVGGLLMISNADEIQWGYEGDSGPSEWAALAPEFVICGEGKAQSPIDIRDAVEAALVDIAFHYGETANNIVNNGHTIQVNVDSGSHIVYNGITYDLLQFHFHAPSEHTIAGEAAPMEIHFVHKDRNSNNLAVVGILLSEGESANEAYAPIIDNMPAIPGAADALGDELALTELLPERRGYYTYQGSLTTPPCSEVARWLLLDTPVALSSAQIAAYRAIYDGNARPLQPLGERDLLHTSR
ncbi:MAG: carbonic anhydrase family protein [Chloroflexota bacterium]|nr:carbonic anhydrase family protein [Chloroflexota bacterium]